MTSRLAFAPQARDDLRAIYLYIAEAAGADRAIGYIQRIEAFCRGLCDFPQRSARRDDLAAGLRVIGFERRASIAFHIGPGLVTIDRILYGGRDLNALRDAE